MYTPKKTVRSTEASKNKGYPRRFERPKTKTTWDEVAPWYDAHLTGEEGTYQKELILPNVLRILAPAPGQTICDIACGQGFFSRAFAAAGARVIGIDASPRLIKAAIEKTTNLISYRVEMANNLKSIAPESCDGAVIILALQNMEDVYGALSEAARVLKKGGRLIIVLNHPAFRIPKESEWGWDGQIGVQYRRIEGYYNEWKIRIQMHPGDAPEVTTISFHRPLQYYAKALRKAGFMIAGIEEWISHKKSQKGPRQEAENKARKEIPLFMEIEAVKTNGKEK